MLILLNYCITLNELPCYTHLSLVMFAMLKNHNNMTLTILDGSFIITFKFIDKLLLKILLLTNKN